MATTAEKTELVDHKENKELTSGEAGHDTAEHGVDPGATQAALKTTESAPKIFTPLEDFYREIPRIIETSGHNEMWGVVLEDESHVPTSIVLEKFLRANANDWRKAAEQLTEALKWRKKMNPAGLVKALYDKERFGGLGYVTTYETEHGLEIITWNIYGAVKNKKVTFGNIDEFIRWRCTLMELAVMQLNLAAKTERIPTGGVDQYRMIQVHDYLNVSFLRQDPDTKAATKETISVLAKNYPELLKQKFFVNVPLLMSWMFAAAKLIVAPETIKKFHPLSWGSALAGCLPEIGEKLPVSYGGKGEELEGNALTPTYGKALVGVASP